MKKSFIFIIPFRCIEIIIRFIEMLFRFLEILFCSFRNIYSLLCNDNFFYMDIVQAVSGSKAGRILTEKNVLNFGHSTC